jgi:signal transduction histidine kinase
MTNTEQLLAKKNAELEKELAEKNHELEIEAALERVRAIALSMKKPADMLEVCKIIAQQLYLLNVKEIRNVQTAIFYESKGTYMNYEYYAKHDKAFITETSYTNHEIHRAFAEQMLKGKGEFFSTHISKAELPGWIAYQKSTNVFIDDYLETAASLNYYWFSLGAVALGVSTYQSLKQEDINLFKRFLKVFELSYTRYLDIEQAIAQTREAQIQLALERVRARAMAMQTSEELNELISTVFIELTKLDFVLTRCVIEIYEGSDKGCRWWMANSEAPSTPMSFFVKYADLPFFNMYLEGWKEKSLKWQYILEDENKIKTDDFLFNETELSLLPDFVIAGMRAPKSIYLNASFNNFGNLTLASVEPLSDEHFDILLRFAKVFDLTYTRFNDLRQAEAQTRESQIQLALERVRARTMAMQKSDELTDVAALLFRQCKNLGYEPDRISIGIMQEEKQIIELWATDAEADEQRQFYQLPFNEPHVISRCVKAWKEQNKSLVLDLYGQPLKEYAEFWKSLGAVEDARSTVDQVVFNFAFFSKGYLGFISFEHVPPQIIELLERFAGVFDITYTRFLDLQKAEAQTREAQIETALEKVRSRSLAVHKSDEFNEVIKVVFERLQELRIPMTSVSINVFIHGSKDTEAYICGSGEDGLTLSHIRLIHFNHPISNDRYDAYEKGFEFFTKTYTEDEKNSFYEYEFEVSDLKYIPSDIKKMMMESKRYTCSLAFAKNSMIVVNDFEGKSLSSKQIDIVKRFAKVFDQSYTRFLDLQKAEAQAREAQIETALEKVRAIAMSMLKSDELMAVCEAVFKQLQILGFENVRAAQIYIRNDAEEKFLNYDYSDVTGADVVEVSYNSHANTKRIYDVIRNAGDGLVHNMIEKDELDAWKCYLYDTLGQPHEKDLDKANELHYYLYSFETGAFGICTFKAIAEDELQILKRFRNVFSLSYQRYSDIALAEAQAKEAKIEASLERVRSRTLAMQKSDELAETSAVLFKQLILLGISPNRLYISIIKDNSGETEFWITDEDGSKVSMAYEDNLNNNSSFKKMFDGWKQQKKSLVIDMQGEELEDYFKHLSSIHVPFKGGLTQKRRLQYIAYFNRGFIGMASPDEQPKETIDLLERFSYVFNLTFTRFNDLQVAEAHAVQAEQDLIEIKLARQKAENALSELQSTQKQLIQSEKMASLGELTAGIAHEIQNPLNFVNNFSEVNEELLGELVNEFEKGNTEEAKAIASDIKQNLEKINHHGKRADAIVKGMLQHSRKNSGQKEPTDINALCDEYLRLSYHGLRAKDKSFNANFKTDFDDNIGKINVVPQDIGRVLLNLFNNSFYAVNEKQKLMANSYQPIAKVSTRKLDNIIEIRVEDNGPGIPQNIIDKIFQPFFTTKPTGQGTGLGLSLAYDIITKEHNGTIKVESKEGEGSTFIIELPA